MARGIAMIVTSNKERLDYKGYTNDSAWFYHTEHFITTLASGSRSIPNFRILSTHNAWSRNKPAVTTH